jgi:hypothetical protein
MGLGRGVAAESVSASAALQRADGAPFSSAW